MLNALASAVEEDIRPIAIIFLLSIISIEFLNVFTFDKESLNRKEITPKSTSKKKYKELIGKPYTKYPDGDNICKAVCDGLNGIAFDDDKQISEIHVYKKYAKKACTVVEIEEIKERK